ncbi:MAG: cytochrome c biogenesis protein CcsA [Thermoplasmatales archaeon]|nr:MAG: cytochrome c biogenesis protein CcsA [Thermoplasmatales archaeon]
MSIGNLLVYLSLFLAIIGILLSFLRLKTKEDKFLQVSRIITTLLFATISITLVYLYILFIKADISIDYVWRYTSITHPIQYKFAGVLAGMAGSLLFWIWAIITPWLYEEMKTIKRSVNEDIRDWTRIALFIVMTVLIFILILHDIFKPTAANLLISYPNGQGLNPLLQTELMVIHPPIVFLAYGFIAVPFAAALAYLITGHKDWISYSLKWSRIGWIFLMLGIGIGALWAYVVLGWGGYWGWDPVETSSLLPWIILTGFLHTQLMYKRKKSFPILAPVLGVLSFVLVIFATFVTRAGGLWLSVHTFGQANVQIDPLQRFINILGENQTVLTYMIFIIVSLLITALLVIYRYIKIKKSRKEQFFTLSELISDDILMLVTVFLFIITTIVTFVILVNSVNALNPSDFNVKVGTLSLATVLVLIFCLLWKYTGRRWITIIGGCTLLASAIGFIFFPNNRIVAASLPILFVALVGAGYKLIRSFNIRRVWKSVSIASAHLIHLAIILLLLGYVGSNFLVLEDSISLSIGGSGEEVGKYIFYATDSSIVDGINFVEIDADLRNYVYQTEYVDVKVMEGDSIIGNKRLIMIMSTSLVTGENKLLRNEIKVLDTFMEDIYLTYQQAYEDNEGEIESVEINVKILPLMKLLWGGMWLMALGMVLRIACEKKLPMERYIEKKRDKDEKHYEDLVEEELKKYKK